MDLDKIFYIADGILVSLGIYISSRNIYLILRNKKEERENG